MGTGLASSRTNPARVLVRISRILGKLTAGSEQNSSLRIALKKQLIDLKPDCGLFPRLLSIPYATPWPSEVSNFEQTDTAKERRLVSGSGHEVAHVDTDQSWLYAKEAVLSAAAAKTDGDRQGLLELARTWTQAALHVRSSSADPDCAV